MGQLVETDYYSSIKKIWRNHGHPCLKWQGMPTLEIYYIGECQEPSFMKLLSYSVIRLTTTSGEMKKITAEKCIKVVLKCTEDKAKYSNVFKQSLLNLTLK